MPEEVTKRNHVERWSVSNPGDSVSSQDIRRLNEERLAYVVFMCNSLLRLADVNSTWKLVHMSAPAAGVAQVELRFRCDFPYRYEGAPNTPSRKTIRVVVDVID